MGSSGHYSAEMSLVKKISLLQQKENTNKEIEEFFNEIGVIYVKTTFKNLDYNADKIYAVIHKDELDDDDYTEIYIDEYFLDKKYITYKELKDLKTSESNSADLNWFIDYTRDVKNLIYFVEHNLEDLKPQLKFANLNLLKKYTYLLSTNPIEFNVESEKNLGEINEYIYGSSSNYNEDHFTITQKFIDSLQVGDVLRIKGQATAY